MSIMLHDTGGKVYHLNDTAPLGCMPSITIEGKTIPYNKLREHYRYTEPNYTDYMLTWLNVHPNQYKAGSDIIDYFNEGIKDVILLAEMQSGKTGCTRYVVHALQNLSGQWPGRFTPDNIYFICGMNDNDLRAQAITEFSGFIPPENILFSKQLQKFNNQDGSGSDSDSGSVIKPSLVIIDESHYASFRSSQVDKFLTRVQHEEMLTLSVSATAMAELASSELACKGRVYLEPGDDYYGMRNLFERDLIKQSVDITHDKEGAFVKLVEEEYDMQEGNPKYNIVRLPNQWYYKDLEEDIADIELDVKFINHHTCTKMSALDFNEYIKDPPDKFTIIWIYGSLRAGKQLNTANLGFVHDTASSGPDIIAQSLMGRILGYGKSKHYVRCYTDVKSARLMKKWVDSLYDVMKIPIGCKNIIGGYNETLLERNWELHVPILVQLPPDMRTHYRTLKQIHGQRYPYKNDFLVDLALTATDDREKIIDIFETYQPGHCGGLMILTEENKPKSFRDHWGGNFQAYVSRKLVRCCDIPDGKPGKYFYVYVNLNIESLQYGTALVTYKEHKEVGGQVDSTSVRVKSKSRFSIKK